MAPTTQSKAPAKSQAVEPSKETGLSGHFKNNKYTYWRRSILLGIVLSIYLGYTKGGIYGWAPAAATFYSFVHIFESVAKKPEGIFARLFLVVTNLQRLIDIEDAILSPFRARPVTKAA